MPRDNDSGRDRPTPTPSIERSVADAIRIADRYVTHVMNKPPADPVLERTLDSILKALECLENQGVEIMTSISDFAAKQNTFNTRTGAAIDGIVADIKTMNDLIEKLQNTPGPISPEDQATLDQLEAAGDGVASKAEALDAERPPTPPAG